MTTTQSDGTSSVLALTHSHTEGTLLGGTERGDGSGPIAKAHRLRWSRALGCWYLPASRDRVAQLATLQADALRAAGHEVTVSIDDTPRPVDVAEADRAARQDARVEALTCKAERAQAHAQSAARSADDASERLPWGGEPIKVGHHSEGRHRRDINRAHTTMRRALDAQAHAEVVDAKARAAATTTAARHNPVTVANRIATLEAIERSAARALSHASSPEVADRLEAKAAHLAEQLTYWRRVRGEQIATGHATDYGPGTVRPGDAVKIRGQWRRVARSNTKSVSVETGYSWTDRAPWHEVQDHRPVTD